MFDLLVNVLCGCGIALSIGITIALIVAFVMLFKSISDM